MPVALCVICALLLFLNNSNKPVDVRGMLL